MADFAHVVSKQFCSNSAATFSVRRRPRAVHGGGFVVNNCSRELIFTAEGCGTLGVRGEMVLKDANGIALVLIGKKELSFRKQWKAYSLADGEERLIFNVKMPSLCFGKANSIKVFLLSATEQCGWDFEINGSFTDRACTKVDRQGKLVAEVSAEDPSGRVVSKDLYHVTVQPGFDQAFVFGIISILDNMYKDSTSC